MVDSANRRQIVLTTGSAAIDADSTIGQAFTLIDVVVNLDAAATTADVLSISSKRTISAVEYTVLEAFQTMSVLSSPEDVSKVFRFDKKFPAGTEINVTFTNTDTNAVTVLMSYELDTIGA